MEKLKKMTLGIGDHFKINIHSDKEVLYKVVMTTNNFVAAEIVYPKSLALELLQEGPFMIDVSTLCIEVVGNDSDSPLLNIIYN